MKDGPEGYAAGARLSKSIQGNATVVVVLLSLNMAPPSEPEPRFGFVKYAEVWNGRVAMMGFVLGLVTEQLTGQGILEQIGLSSFKHFADWSLPTGCATMRSQISIRFLSWLVVLRVQVYGVHRRLFGNQNL
eukprot:g34157.t1